MACFPEQEVGKGRPRPVRSLLLHTVPTPSGFQFLRGLDFPQLQGLVGLLRLEVILVCRYGHAVESCGCGRISHTGCTAKLLGYLFFLKQERVAV